MKIPKLRRTRKVLKANRRTLHRPFVALWHRYRDAPALKEATLPTGRPITVMLPTYTSEMLYLNLPWEADVMAFMQEVVKPGENYFDVGGHIGSHAIAAQELVGNQGKVVTFEPMPQMHPVLEANAARYDNVEVVKAAVSDGTVDELNLKWYGYTFAGSTTESNIRLEGGNDRKLNASQHVVPATSIDRYVSETGVAPDVIKIDVEGGERSVLIGAERTLQDFRPAVIFEVGDIGRTPETRSRACIDHLVDRGYKIRVFDSERGVVKHELREVYDAGEILNLLAVPS